MKFINSLLLTALLFSGCYSTTSTVEPTPEPTQLTNEPVPEPTPKPIQLTNEPVPEPSPTPGETNPSPTGVVFEVTKEVYEKTYNEIDLLIADVTKVIRNHDYKGWVPFLTEEYKITKSDSEYLKKISQAPAIKNRNKELETLEDYFLYVIVPSRAKTILEKIIFEDENHVKAYGTIFNKRGILYYLEKINGQWKIGIW